MLFTNPWLQHKTKQTLQLIFVLATVFLSSPTMAQVDPVKEALDNTLASTPNTDIGLFYDLGGAMPIPVGGSTRVNLSLDPTSLVGMSLGCDNFGVFASMEGILEDTQNSIFSAYQGIVNFATQGIMKLALFTVVQTGAPDLYNSLMELLEKAKLDYDFQLGQCKDIEQDILNSFRGYGPEAWEQAMNDSFRNEQAVKIFKASGKEGDNNSIHRAISNSTKQVTEEGIPCPCSKEGEEKRCLQPGTTFDLVKEILSCGYDVLDEQVDDEHKSPFAITNFFPTKEEFIEFGKEILGRHIIVTAEDGSRRVQYEAGPGPNKRMTDITYSQNELILEAIKDAAERADTGDLDPQPAIDVIKGFCEGPTPDIIDYMRIASGRDVADFAARVSARQGPYFTAVLTQQLNRVLTSLRPFPDIKNTPVYASAINYFKQQIKLSFDVFSNEEIFKACSGVNEVYQKYSEFVFNKRNAAASIETPAPSNELCIDNTGNIIRCPSSGVQPNNPGLN